MRDKLYITDLDGTLVNSGKEIDRFSVQAINMLIASGLKITYATARSFISAHPIIKDINFRMPAITYNGACITGPAGDILRENLLDMDIYTDILAQGKRLGLDAFTCARNENGDERLDYVSVANIAQKNYIDERKNRNDKRLLRHEGVFDRILQVLFIDSLQTLQPFRDYIVNRYADNIFVKMVEDIYSPTFFSLEIYNKKANKGDMLVELCSMLNIDTRDTVVFGDQLNDLELFENAGLKVAVGNAHNELKKKADIVLVESNDANAVAKFIGSAVDGFGGRFTPSVGLE
jgi:Cof subfamily protein (haloacid dehalogenase superfamily)